MSANATCMIREQGPQTEMMLPKSSMLRGCIGWELSQWSVCAHGCGAVVRQRTVQCSVDTVADCDSLKMPNDHEACEDYSSCKAWVTGTWTTCSSVCGAGTQRRAVHCPAGKRCDIRSPPPHEKACIGSAQCAWQVGPWSSCNCATRNSTRNITCQPSGLDGDCNSKERDIDTRACYQEDLHVCNQMKQKHSGAWLKFGTARGLLAFIIVSQMLLLNYAC